MGVESIPLLTAIIATVGSILKAIWEGIKTQASQIWLWISLVIPWTVRQFGRYWLLRATLLGVAIAGIRSIFHVAFAFLSDSFHLEKTLVETLDDFPWMLHLLFGPMSADVLFSVMFDVLSTWAGLISTRVLLTKSFYVFRMMKMLVNVK